MYNRLGACYLFLGIAVYLTAWAGLDLAEEVAVAAGITAATLVACLTDRVPTGVPFARYFDFPMPHEATSPPDLRIALAVFPVALSGVALGVIVPIEGLLTGRPAPLSPMCLAFVIAGAVNGVLFLATIPVRSSTFTPPRPRRASAPRAEWGGLGHCPQCGSEGDWDGKRCGHCGHREAPV